MYSLHEQCKSGLISLETIFGDHMMRILHRMVYNMLMVLQFSTFLLYISSKKVKEKVKLEHITDDITSFVDAPQSHVLGGTSHRVQPQTGAHNYIYKSPFIHLGEERQWR
ncbi:uncharacterized protein [Apostichopus japonicus]|uniref:uncharacterized protein isoform X2 n=1 Tax=Stichopus japonicus TaxID=307972 RepID=UPI003AB4A63F